MRDLVGIVLVVALAGCHLTPQEEARDVCDAYCKCVGLDLPGAQRDCVEQECLPQVPQVTDACLSCVFEHDRTCGELIDTCTDLCLQNSTQLLGGAR